MILEILPRPSKLCGNCNKYENNCPCICHKEALFDGFHENAYKIPVGEVENVTEFDDDEKIL